jgi:hypothetical protein
MPASRRSKLLTALLASVVAAGGVAIVLTAVLHPRAPAASKRQLASSWERWSEESWPFPIDQWGTGRAFRCDGGACGDELHLYLRAKIGFCRCATGVSDDDEIDRVGDTVLFGRKYEPSFAGHPVVAGLLVGRARQFTVHDGTASPIPVLTIALANKCDAVVATVAAGPDLDATRETAALAFLRGDQIQRWAAANTQSQ